MYTLVNISKTIISTKLRHFSSAASTIFALSSGQGKCGVAVIRVSGPNSGKALKYLTCLESLPKPRNALLKRIYNPVSKEILDRGLILWFPGPNSFSGEDCCEFQIHGGIAVISAVLNALSTIPNTRPAEPGEFTRRAFYSGKLDLTEVEGLADLLQAETELQRKQAFLQVEGALSKLYSQWRTLLIKSVANIEAHIDFEETESLENDLLISSVQQMKKLHCDIQIHLNDGRKGEILRNGVKTVIIGEPNVGKSSLLNILCNKPAAIVTPIEGTTRDLLEISLDINGYPIVLTDTAGLRQNTEDIIEQEGIRRAKNTVQTANLIFLVIDVTKFIKWTESHSSDSLLTFVKHYMENIGLNTFMFNSEQSGECKYVVVLNKSDLIHDSKKDIINKVLNDNKNAVLVSCSTQDGLPTFLNKITKHLKEICGTPTKEHPSMNQERHRSLLLSCANHLELFLLKAEDKSEDIVLMAQHLKSALRQLGKLTGHVTTEQLLDVIFKDFCIGK